MKNKCSSCNGTGKQQYFLETPKVPPEECYSCKGSGIGSTWKDNLICPYCGYEDEDSWELGESDSDYQCGSCEKHFTWDTEVTRTFSSRQAACLNGGEHRTGKPIDFETYNYIRCLDCDFSKREPKIASEPADEA